MLAEALETTGQAGEVLCPFDDFSFGPIGRSDYGRRAQWVEEELNYKGWAEQAEKAELFLNDLKSARGPLVAWTSRRHSGNYSGFLWFLSNIGDLETAIIFADDLPIVNVEGMSKLLGNGIPLKSTERTVYKNRWKELVAENAPLRIIDGTILTSAPINHFDNQLLRHATTEWQLIGKIVSQVLAEFYEDGIYQTGSLVLSARLAVLAKAGALEWQGELAESASCNVRLPRARRRS